MLASEAARFLSKPFAQLTRAFPGLYRRQATPAEKLLLDDVGLVRGSSPFFPLPALSFLSSFFFPRFRGKAYCPLATLVLTKEIDAINARDATAMHALQSPPAPALVAATDPLGRPYQLARLVHSPATGPTVAAAPAPAAPAGNGSAAAAKSTARTARRPANPLAPAFARSHGLASPADERPVQLVPVRLNVELDGLRLREVFTWNLHVRFFACRPAGCGLRRRVGPGCGVPDALARGRKRRCPCGLLP